jgi:RNA polymerase sigma-70 factor (ECF subfamily)
MPIQTEEEMIRLLKRGDLAAFNELFNTFYFPLYFCCRKYVPDPEEAKDLMQNVFLRFWDKREEITIEVSIKSYLFRSVQNECLNYIRSVHNKVSFGDIENDRIENLPHSSTPDIELEKQELEETIHAIMEELPLQCKKIFIMSRMKGLKNKEIAEKLAVSIRTVDTQIYRALKIFKTKLKSHLAV